MVPESNAVDHGHGTARNANQLAVPAAAGHPKVNLDWMQDPPPPGMTEFQHFVKGLDWQNTKLGPMSTWPRELKQMVRLIMADSNPSILYWGDSFTLIYNEAYIPMIGEKHPDIQGKDAPDAFPDFWPYFDGILNEQRFTGKPAVGEASMLLMERHGFLEETYFNWRLIPIIGDDGEFKGSYGSPTDLTWEVISARRRHCIQHLAQQISQTSNMKDLWDAALSALTIDDKDIPFALLYSVEQQTTLVAPPSQLTFTCKLEGTIGVPADHAIAKEYMDAQHEVDGFSPTVLEALMNEGLVVLDADNPNLQGLLSGINWQGFGLPCHQFVIVPLRADNEISALLIAGINPYRRFNKLYDDFLSLIGEVLRPQIAKIRLSEEVRRRSEIARKAKLAFEKSEARFSRFAERSIVGLAVAGTNRELLYANDAWHRIAGIDPSRKDYEGWLETVHPDDVPLVQEWWDRVLNGQKGGQFQYRCKQPFHQGSMHSEHKTLICAVYPDWSESGSVESVMGIVFDVSELKWVEEQLRVQTKTLAEKMDEALRLKVHQERFIDMISHEIRNPLSAVLHCGEEIVESMKKCLTALDASHFNTSASSQTTNATLRQQVYATLDAANTVMYCVQHQKQIVDDVLTLSKLDADLLLVSPVPVCLTGQNLVQSALKVFQPEMKMADIALSVVEEDSLSAMGVEWILLDPNRFLQVVINLVTNAIKFTRTSSTREINIRVSVFPNPPAGEALGVEYVPRRYTPVTPRSSDAEDPEEDIEILEEVYLSFSVQDTGKGLTQSEMTNLFNRFAQASPKTHIEYGGSGLGLFISRQITEMMGGEIGMSSTDCGCTFAFYVKAFKISPRRRSSVSIEPILQLTRTLSLTSTAAPLVVPPGQESDTTVDLMLITPPDERSEPKHEDRYVLVVEDNLVNQKVLCKLLRSRGFMVQSANHGKEAFDVIGEFRKTHEGRSFEVVLCDIEMPVMDGIEFTKEVRAMESKSELPHHSIIGVTANVRSQQVTAAIEAGMDGVTTKPYRIDDLIAHIDKVCSDAA
ncbi:hypothetical protein BX600DRAFT_388716 [Xylariales sp. PMI_506]|nr:hypothetical protein BX600DRAFT_388716 [Xylariales sp. PMI_506]